MEPVGRLFLCANCRAQTLICTACDRGQRYCSPKCASDVRRTRVREAGRRYQRSEQGRAAHARRMQSYRARLTEVTHQGSVSPHRHRQSAPCSAPLMTTPNAVSALAIILAMVAMAPPRCNFCGCTCSQFVRLSFLRRSKRPIRSNFSTTTRIDHRSHQ